MLLGILKKTENYFVGKTLGGQHIKVNNFELGSEINEGQIIELDLEGLNYEKLGKGLSENE